MSHPAFVSLPEQKRRSSCKDNRQGSSSNGASVCKDNVSGRLVPKAIKRFKYEGVQDCRAAILAGGGDKACRYGCLGYGTCSRVCPFGAITMTEDPPPIC